MKYSIFTNPPRWGIITTDDKSPSLGYIKLMMSTSPRRTLGACRKASLPASPSQSERTRRTTRVGVPATGGTVPVFGCVGLFYLLKYFENEIKYKKRCRLFRKCMIE